MNTAVMPANAGIQKAPYKNSQNFFIHPLQGSRSCFVVGMNAKNSHYAPRYGNHRMNPRFPRALLLVAMLGGAPLVQAAASDSVELHIAPRSLDSALTQFADQGALLALAVVLVKLMSWGVSPMTAPRPMVVPSPMTVSPMI